MATTIKVHGTIAVIDGGEWTTTDPDLLSVLTMLLPDDRVGYDPDPDYADALAALRELGGELVVTTEVRAPGPGISY